MIKLLLVFTFIATPFFTDDVDIKTINNYKQKAESAFNQKDYVAAANYYTTLIDSFGVDEPELKLNLAHSYYNASQNDLATKAYQQISANDNKMVSSLANKQLGAMALDNKKLEDALKYFKDALKNNPTDYENQYNYELVKKLLKEQEEEKKKEQDKDQDNKDQDKKDQEKKDQKQDQKDQQKNQQEQKDQQKKENQDKKEQDQKGEENKENQDKKEEQQKKEGEGEKEQDDKEKKDELEKKGKSEDEKNDEKNKKNSQQKQQERLQKINMSAAKAKMILDAMKNNETKYYQQLKRKSAKKKDRSKPDW